MKSRCEEIARLLLTVIPKEWKKLALYVELGDFHSSCFFYLWTSSQKDPIQSLELPDISKREILSVQKKITEEVRIVWNEAKKEKGVFSHYTLLLDSEYAFHEYYDYTPLEDCPADYSLTWRKKYIER